MMSQYFIRSLGLPSRRTVLTAAVTVTASLAFAACKDSNVPFFTAPTSVPNSPAGIQNAITGLFAGSRIDMVNVSNSVVAGYARDGAVFTNTEARTVEYPLGVNPTPASSGTIWAQEYQNIVQGHQVLAAIPKVAPPYSDAEVSALTGLVQTMIAYNYMLVAEAHDTLGIAIQGPDISTTPPAAVCLKDGWAYIVALLDSANANLNTAGATAFPVSLPKGFGALTNAGPSTAAGTMASFNRALAAKANLELAYAIARTPTNGANAPTPLLPGAPNQPALTEALAALDSSGMYNPSQLGPDPSGGFTPGLYAVTHDFSATSGDLVNPVNGEIGTLAQLNDFVASVDTVNDLRWKAKFGKNPNAVQQQLYNLVASKYIPIMYHNPAAPIPIVREVQLVLWHAQILMAQGPANYAAALADINAVRTTVGGLAAYPAGDASTYLTLRNDLLKEQRISTTWESSADRTIALRMYGLAVVADTTWNGKEDPLVQNGANIDVHTTVLPIPQTELLGRGGSFTTTCN